MFLWRHPEAHKRLSMGDISTPLQRMVLWSHPEAHIQLSMSGISTPLKNGSLEPSGSSQVAVHECYLNIPKE